MEQIDQATLERVWARVQNRQSAPSVRGELYQLLLRKQEDLAVYRRLTGSVSGRHRNALTELIRQDKDQLACLKGIMRMETGSIPSLPSPSAPAMPIAQALRHCYSRALQCLQSYESRADDPNYAGVFALLARKQRQQCLSIAQLLGEI